MPDLRGAALATREVTADDALFERYAERVPVLRVGNVAEDLAEMDWPFSAERLRGLLDGA
jgi:hypothetical protein